ncbi:hypothetical protein ABPG72_020151 [Tetrahymena utriculariae]
MPEKQFKIQNQQDGVYLLQVNVSQMFLSIFKKDIIILLNISQTKIILNLVQLDLKFILVKNLDDVLLKSNIETIQIRFVARKVYGNIFKYPNSFLNLKQSSTQQLILNGDYKQKLLLPTIQKQEDNCYPLNKNEEL